MTHTGHLTGWHKGNTIVWLLLLAVAAGVALAAWAFYAVIWFLTHSD